MADLHTLPRRKEIDDRIERKQRGDLVALPFIELATVLKTMEMLRSFPDQSVLDEFNRVTVPPTTSDTD